MSPPVLTRKRGRGRQVGTRFPTGQGEQYVDPRLVPKLTFHPSIELESQITEDDGREFLWTLRGNGNRLGRIAIKQYFDRDKPAQILAFNIQAPFQSMLGQFYLATAINEIFDRGAQRVTSFYPNLTDYGKDAWLGLLQIFPDKITTTNYGYVAEEKLTFPEEGRR